MSGWALGKGFTQAEIDKMIVAEFRYDPTANNGLLQGQAGATVEQLRAIAKRFFVPVSDAALGMWVTALTKGTEVQESFVTWVKESAKGMFPMLAGQIDAGMDVATLLNPYAQVLQQELGIADVDMSDPRYMGGLMVLDPKTGTRTMPNLDQWREYIRTNPSYGWENTVGSQNMTADLGLALTQEMGVRR
jgi:hypothetical protein